MKIWARLIYQFADIGLLQIYQLGVWSFQYLTILILGITIQFKIDSQLKAIFDSKSIPD